MALLYDVCPFFPLREEQLKAKGLSTKSIAEAEEEQKHTDMKFVLPELTEDDSSTDEKSKPPREAQKKLTETKGASGSSETEHQQIINDKDLPSSTPVAPPLNVPIVTHATKNTEGSLW